MSRPPCVGGLCGSGFRRREEARGDWRWFICWRWRSCWKATRVAEPLNYRAEEGSNAIKTGWNLSPKTIEKGAFKLYSQKGTRRCYSRGFQAQRVSAWVHRKDSVLSPVFGLDSDK